MSTPTKRDRLVDSAAILFHKQGMVSTSLADIAKHAEIPIGNVYYYFKTKDELALAALDKRKTAMEQVCAQLDAAFDDPRERLTAVLRFFETMKDDYSRYGCPIYRMIVDGGEAEGNVAKAATDIFELFVAWAEKEFKQMGHDAEARKLALALLAGIEGAITVGRSFSSADIMAAELERLVAWLESLPNKRIFLGKARTPQSA